MDEKCGVGELRQSLVKAFSPCHTSAASPRRLISVAARTVTSNCRENKWAGQGSSWHREPVRKNYFDEPVARRYDADSGDMFDPAVVEPAVSFIADLADSGAALELGVGTGRIALPLSQRGIRVHGIDLSPDMIAQLRAKPGGDSIDVSIGDFATTTVDQTFHIAYLVSNTIENLPSQTDKVEASRNLPATWRPAGCSATELEVRQPHHLPPAKTARPSPAPPPHPGSNESDTASQGLASH